LREKLQELQLRLRDGVDRLTADDVSEERRAETIAQLIAHYQLIPIRLHDADKTIERRETTFTREDGWGDRIKVAGLEVTVSIPFDGSVELWKLRPSSYKVSGTPVAVVNGRTLTLAQDFQGVPKPEEVRAWYQREIETVRWYLGKVAEQVTEHNAQIESMSSTLIRQRVAKLDALRMFDEELDLDEDVG
jgi:hypothetical protein